MSNSPTLRIYMVLGEASGDALGADIVASLKRRDIEYELGGLAGHKMQELGANSLFDVSQLSMMGFTAVLSKLPKIYSLVHRVVDDIISFNPDIVVLIDSPDFSYAVAKRVKKRDPNISIVKYICPSVWAWRQGRAKKITAYIDHILAILPFEPDLMKQLEGPPTTYVGHPLSRELARFGNKDRSVPAKPVNLLVLPGSRKGEAKRLLPVIRDSLMVLRQRGMQFNAILPAVDHLTAYIRDEIKYWPVKPEIVTGKEAKHLAFQSADLALACSGTVLLELGLYAIPTVSIYKLDSLGFIVRRMVRAWTASLPNLIVDQVIIPERFEEYAHPQSIARVLERLSVQGPERNAQIRGFKLLRNIMLLDDKNPDFITDKILKIADWDNSNLPTHLR